MGDDSDTVAECFGCPRCGERRVDELAWIDDETVQCQSCGTHYRLEDDHHEPTEP